MKVINFSKKSSRKLGFSSRCNCFAISTYLLLFSNRIGFFNRIRLCCTTPFEYELSPTPDAVMPRPLSGAYPAQWIDWEWIRGCWARQSVAQTFWPSPSRPGTWSNLSSSPPVTFGGSHSSVSRLHALATYLAQQVSGHGRVAYFIRGHSDSPNLLCLGIDTQVHLAPKFWEVPVCVSKKQQPAQESPWLTIVERRLIDRNTALCHHLLNMLEAQGQAIYHFTSYPHPLLQEILLK